ncbi:MAG TPA: indole-3-glycerol phosphate synthase TrpC, partial [Acidimicrobiales bacterium]
MAPTYLDDIVAYHRGRVNGDARDWRERLETVRYEGPSMLAALTDPLNPNIKVIAEVKRRSPSKGWIDEHLNAVSLALAYEGGGATAISVLTEQPHFAGSLDDLSLVRSAVSIPLLRKDFTLSANDVIDTAAMGASAVLLIVAVLDDDELALLASVASQCGIDALVEVHDADETRRALDLGATIIGVNQRDLRTFEVSSRRAAALAGS